MAQNGNSADDNMKEICDLEKYYQDLSVELSDRAVKVLTNNNNDSSQVYLESLKTAWDDLNDSSHCTQVHLHNASQYNKAPSSHMHSQLGHDLKSCCHNQKSAKVITAAAKIDGLIDCCTKALQDLVIKLNSTQAQTGGVKGLAQTIRATVSSLLCYQGIVDRLVRESTSIVPVHLRKLPVKQPLKAHSLVSYGRNMKVKLKKYEECFLLDNSDPHLWKIRQSSGVESRLPALLFVIPPPDHIAMQHAYRLREQLILSWSDCVRACKSLSSSTLSQYLTNNDPNQMSYMTEDQRARAVDWLSTAQIFLSTGQDSTSAAQLRTAANTWKTAASSMSSQTPDRRGISNKLEAEFSSNKKLVELVEDMELYLTEYRESAEQNQSISDQLMINTHPTRLKYVSMAYIHPYPVTSGELLRDDHVIVSELGGLSGYMFYGDTELEEFTTETITQSSEDDGEFTSQTIKETQRFVIRSVIDPRTGEEISIYDALSLGIINQSEGTYINPVTGETTPIQEAMDRGLIIVEFINRSVEMGELIRSGVIKTITTKETTSYMVLSIKDPHTGNSISVAEAIKRGIVDPDNGRYVIDKSSGLWLSIPSAIDKGFLEVKVLDRRPTTPPPPQTPSAEDIENFSLLEGGRDLEVRGVYDPRTMKTVSLDEAVKSGLIDLSKGVVVNPITGKESSIEEAIQSGVISAHMIDDSHQVDNSSLLGKRMYEAGSESLAGLQQSLGSSAEEILRPIKRDLKQNLLDTYTSQPSHLADHQQNGALMNGDSTHDKNRNNYINKNNNNSGEPVDVEQALKSGQIDLETLTFETNDGEMLPLVEAASRGLVDENGVIDLVNKLDQYSLSRMIETGQIDLKTGKYRDPATGKLLPLSEALTNGMLNPAQIYMTDSRSGNILSLKEATDQGLYNPNTGKFKNPGGNGELSLAEAVSSDVINPALDPVRLGHLVAELAKIRPLLEDRVEGIRDPHTGREVNIQEAVQQGILDLDTLEFLDKRTNEKIPLSQAIESHLIHPDTARKLVDSLNDRSLQSYLSKGLIDPKDSRVIDPKTKRRITVRRAIDTGVINPQDVILVDLAENKPVTLQQLIDQGRYDPETGLYRDPTSGTSVSLAEALSLGYLGAEVSPDTILHGGEMSVDKLLSKKEKAGDLKFVLPNGQVVTVEEAMRKGFISGETQVKVDPTSGHVVLVTDSAPASISNGILHDSPDGRSKVKKSFNSPDDTGSNIAAEYITELMSVQAALEQLQELDSDVTRAKVERGSAPRQLDQIKQDMKKYQALKSRLDSIKPGALRALGRAEDLLSKEESESLPVDQRKRLANHVQQLNSLLDTLSGEISTELSQSSSAVGAHNDLNERLKQLEAWSRSADQRLGGVKRRAAHTNNPRDLISETQALVEEISSKQSSLTALEGLSADPAGSRSLDSITNKYTELSDGATNTLNDLNMAASALNQWEESLAAYGKALTNGERAVQGLVESESGDIEQDMKHATQVSVETGQLQQQLNDLRRSAGSCMEAVGKLGMSRTSPICTGVSDRLSELERSTERLHSRVLERQRDLSEKLIQSQDSESSVRDMVEWLERAERALGSVRPVSLDRDVLTHQIQAHRQFSAELDGRAPRVTALLEQGSASDPQLVSSIDERFNTLQEACDQRGQQLEQVVLELSELHNSVDDLEKWLTGAVHSLKRDGGSGGEGGNALKTKIENLYRQKQLKQADLESLKVIGRKLLDSENTGDKHKLRETLADIQAKWHDLTELLVQMISYSALIEIDDLLKYLDKAESDLTSADQISANPETLTAQLKDHQHFHSDLTSKRKAVNETIDKCNSMLRETTNDEADDIKNKLTTIREQADLVYKLSRKRCDALEEALPLANHFAESHADLQSWLYDIEAEVRSVTLPEESSSVEQIKKLLESAKVTQRIIEDHSALMSDLISTGEDLSDLCSGEDSEHIRQDVLELSNRYVRVKNEIKNQMRDIENLLSFTTNDAGDSLDSMLEGLTYINDHIQNSESISANPATVVQQLEDCQCIMEDLKRVHESLEAARALVEKACNSGDLSQEEQSELLHKMSQADSLYKSVESSAVSRYQALTSTLGASETFTRGFTQLIQQLQGIQDNLLSQDCAGIDPATVREQLRELEMIKEDLRGVSPLVEASRQDAGALSDACGAVGGVEVGRRLEALNQLIDDISEGLSDRDLELNSALVNVENCSHYFEAIMHWLPKSEEKLSNMAAPATDVRALRIQAEELKVFKIDTLSHQSDIQQLNHYASALRNSSPLASESLMPDVREVTDRWAALINDIGDREKQLGSRLIELGDVDHTLDDVIGLLQQLETDLTQLSPNNADVRVIEANIKKILLVQRELTNQEPVVQQLNDAVESMTNQKTDQQNRSSPLVEKCMEMNDSYAVVVVMSRDKLNELQDKLKQMKRYMGEVDDLQMWMKDYRSNLSNTQPLAALPDVALSQVQQFEDGYGELMKKTEDLEGVVRVGDDIMCQCREEDCRDIRDSLSQLTQLSQAVEGKANKHKNRMGEHLQMVDDFHSALREHTEWLNETEKTLATFNNPSKIADKIPHQLDEHKRFREAVDKHGKLVRELERCGAYLLHYGRKQDAVYIKSLLISVRLRWKKLVRRVEDKGRVIGHAQRDARKFHEQWKTLYDWLDVCEQRLRKYTQPGNSSVKQDMEELQNIQQEQAGRQGQYYDVTRLGRGLKDRCSKTDPESEAINRMLDQIKNKWNSVRTLAAQKQSKLDQALLSSGRVSDAVQSLLDWLLKAEIYLAEDQPLLGDLDTVSILVEQHKAFQLELSSRQAMIDAVKEVMDQSEQRPEVKQHMDDLLALWSKVIELSDLREARLQQALELAEEFNDSVQVMREWLPLAEAELKFRSIPEDEDNIIQLIEHHEKFMEELLSQQPNVERISSMADEILNACHPNALRFVKYYLTITQTRWEQCTHRANQRTQRLQEALRNIRGNAALVEELSAWLTEAHALLAAKERDSTPDDLTVVEMLLKQHLEFHEDLNVKSRDMERVTKAPNPSGVSKAYSSSTWRLNDLQDSPSPRVVALQNKWRVVWRMSVDRKKHLQDILDHLLELESFKNFDFDEWRERYISWIRANKFRITDFFRRQDKHGEGTLTRSQFVNGMLISKFPTTRTELNAVFDIFDRNHSGEIDYREFVEALKPTQHSARRAGGAVTDSELIHDEIEQQISHCQCRRLFNYQRVGEGKYKFGERGKMCLVRFLNSTVMVRVGGGWVTLQSFLETNDPCRAKGRTNFELREQLMSPDGSTGSVQSRVNSVPMYNKRRPSTPGSAQHDSVRSSIQNLASPSNGTGAAPGGASPRGAGATTPGGTGASASGAAESPDVKTPASSAALNGRLSGSSSSLSSAGRADRPNNKLRGTLAKSCSNLASSTPPQNSPYPRRRESSVGSNTRTPLSGSRGGRTPQSSQGSTSSLGPSSRVRPPTSRPAPTRGGVTPRAPATRTPVGVGARTPSAPGARTPSAPGTRTPAASGARTPSASGARTPSAGGARGASGSRTPAGSGARTPNRAGARTPTTGTTPIGSRSGSPSGSRRNPAGSSADQSKMSSVKQSMRF